MRNSVWWAQVITACGSGRLICTKSALMASIQPPTADGSDLLFELKRFHKVRNCLLPMAHRFGGADELEKVVSFWRFNYRRSQAIVLVVSLTGSARRHLSSISSRDIDAGDFQAVDRAGFALGLVLRSATVGLLHLRDPTIDVRLYRTALRRAKVINHQRRIFGIAFSFGQFVLRNAHGR